MSGLRGNPENLRALAKSIRRLPTVVAQNVAAKVAPVITQKASSAYSSGQTVYGDARPTGVQGNALSLVETGATKGRVYFVAVGTVVRCVLGTRQSRFLIGKYRILPMGRMPVAWSQSIGVTARQEIQAALP